MDYLYHRVPPNLRGNRLYPLNSIKEKFPDVYEHNAARYIGREHIPRQRIPILNCFWNDVLHFSAVHPKEIKEALISAGREPGFEIKSYLVDPQLIEPENAIVYLYSHTDEKDKLKENNFAPYDPNDVSKFSTMPRSTKDYYKESIGRGGRPLLFHRIPHILYKGTIDINALQTITV